MGCIEYQDSLKTAANVQSSYNGAIVTWWSFRELLPWYTIVLATQPQDWLPLHAIYRKLILT